MLQNVLRQMHQRRLSRTHEGQKILFVHRRYGRAPLGLQPQTVVFVPVLQRAQHMPLLPAGSLAALFHQVAHLGIRQKFQKIRGVGKPPRHPDKADETSPEGRSELQPDPHGNAHDGRRLQNFLRRGHFHKIVIDDSQRAHALDPGVHDQMGGRLAPLGVGVVHMIVERQLAPVFRHFRQVIPGQHPAHHSGRAAGRRTKIMRQLELREFVAMSAHQLLHDLQEHAGGIAAQGGLRTVEHLVVQRLERQQPVGGLSGLQTGQEVDHGVGHAGNLGNDQILDAVRMKIGIVQRVLQL